MPFGTRRVLIRICILICIVGTWALGASLLHGSRETTYTEDLFI